MVLNVSRTMAVDKAAPGSSRWQSVVEKYQSNYLVTYFSHKLSLFIYLNNLILSYKFFARYSGIERYFGVLKPNCSFSNRTCRDKAVSRFCWMKIVQRDPCGEKVVTMLDNKCLDLVTTCRGRQMCSQRHFRAGSERGDSGDVKKRLRN